MTRERLILGCADIDALPLFSRIDDSGRRDGYEPAAAALVAGELGARLEWRVLAWADFYPALSDGRVDAVWCGQGITDARRELADFSRPYAIFDESLVVRADNPATLPTNSAASASVRSPAARTSPWPRPSRSRGGGIPGSEDVYGDMIHALRSDTIDGFVDDDVVMVPLGEEPDLRLSFTVATRNAWGVAVPRGQDDLRIGIDAALDAVVADGRLRAAWSQWMPWLEFPLTP